MSIYILENIFSKISEIATKFTNGKFWQFKTALLCIILTIFFSPPKYNNKNNQWLSDGINKQIEQPFVKQNYPPESHLAKRTYRLTMPIIGHFFNLDIKALLVLQYLFAFIFFGLISQLCYNITSDKVLSIITSIGFAFIYVGKAGIIDGGMFDCTAFFFIIIAMSYKNPIIIFIATILACFVDERAIIATSLVYLWWLIQEGNYKTKTNWELIRGNKYTLSILASIIAIVFIRLIINYYMKLNSPVELGGVGFVQLRKQIITVLLGLFSGIEFFWILILMGALVLLQYKKYLLFLFFILSIGLVSFTASIVADLTRSIAYVFPAIFIVLKLLNYELKIIEVRKIFMVITFLSLSFGTYEVIGPKVYWIFPLIVEFITSA